MATLHTVNKSPFEKRSLDCCIRHANPGSAILLIEDGVYGALKDTAVSDKVSGALDGRKVYVLGPDLHARGMSDDRVIDGVEVVDYAAFVDLVTEHDRVQAWL